MEFRKVSDGCFHEVLSEDTTTPWYRRYHPLFMALDDIVAVDGGSVTVMGVNFADEDSQKPLRQISAKGRLIDENTLIIIDDEGGQLGEFTTFDITLKPTPAWETRTPEEKRGGLFLLYGDLLRYGLEERKAHLCLELPVPEDLFGIAWARVVAKSPLTGVRLSVQADIFQSKLESALSEPWHPKTYGIMKDATSEAVISSLSVLDAPRRIEKPPEEAGTIEEDKPPPPAPVVSVLRVDEQLGRFLGVLKVIAVALVVIAAALVFRLI
jgi:hypothetical protein